MNIYEKNIDKCITNLKNNIENIKYIDLLKNKFRGFKNICIFPMGKEGLYMLDRLSSRGITVNFFCDNDPNKIGKSYRGIKCISLDELKVIKDETIVVISAACYKEIYKQLSNLKFNHLERVLSSKFEIDDYANKNTKKEIEENLKKLMRILSDDKSKKIICKILEGWALKEYSYGFFDEIYENDQYFPRDVINLSDNEIFLDVGAYTGDTLEVFLKEAKNKFKKVILIEMDKSIYSILVKNISNLSDEIRKKIVALNCGAFNEEKIISYTEGDRNSNINSYGLMQAKVAPIDKLLNGEEVTFIKMDIEGAELSALQGAAETIQRYKPKLAICIYHSAEDLYKIPLYIKSLVPEYKIYIRHHTDLLYETVCYAVL